MVEEKSITVLVVDDEEGLREILSLEFSLRGFRVVSAACGRDAFDLVKKEKVDAVVSDVRMPNGDGIELLRNIKSFNPSIRVLLMTGFADLTEAEATSLGAEKLLMKPFSLAELMKTFTPLHSC